MLMRIKELRQASGLSQVELGSKLGMAQNAVSQWETEVALPRVRQLPAIAKALNCSINDLFEQGGEDMASAVDI